jgi:ribosome-binding protein aMBF1 (putative translation factor)
MRAVEVEGCRYVLVAETDYWQSGWSAMPDLPKKGHTLVESHRYGMAVVVRELVRERTALGLTQAELADLAGIQRAVLNRIEKGKVVPAEATLKKLDRVLIREANRLDDEK